MGPRLGRLKARPEFLRVAAAGRKWTTPGLVLQAGSRPGPPLQGERPPEDGRANAPSDESNAETRVGFTVSRKVGGAVLRNRAKRRLRAAAAEVLPALARPGTDYVLIGRQATPKRPFALLKADLAEAVQRVNEPRRPRKRKEEG